MDVQVLEFDQLDRGDHLRLDIVIHRDLVGVDVVHHGEVGDQGALAVGPDLQVHTLRVFDRDVGEAVVDHLADHGVVPGLVLHGFHLQVGEARVAVHFRQLGEQGSDVFVEGLRVIHVRADAQALDLGAGGLAVCDRGAAVHQLERSLARGAAVDQRAGDGVGVEEEGVHRDLVLLAPLLCAERDGGRDDEAVALRVAFDEQVGEGDVSLLLVFQPAVAAIAVDAAVQRALGVGLAVILLEEAAVLLGGLGVGAVLVVLADHLFEAARCGRKLAAAAEGVVDGAQVVHQHADAVGVGDVVTDLDEDHLLAGGVDGEDRLEGLAFHHVQALAAETADPGFQLGRGLEADARHLAQLAGGLEVLADLLALLDEGQAEAVVAVDEQLEGVQHASLVESFIEGDGEKDVGDPLEERVLGLQVDDVLRVVEGIGFRFHLLFVFLHPLLKGLVVLVVYGTGIRAGAVARRGVFGQGPRFLAVGHRAEGLGGPGAAQLHAV